MNKTLSKIKINYNNIRKPVKLVSNFSPKPQIQPLRQVFQLLTVIFKPFAVTGSEQYFRFFTDFKSFCSGETKLFSIMQ
jgi:hypothetical protein